MTIMQLRYFLAICEYGKIRTTSERLHVSEPAISVAIKRLEDAIGAPLFVRDKKQMVLTETGQYLRERASEVLAEFDSLETEMQQFQIRYPRVLRLGIPSSLSEYVFPPFFSEFLETNPTVLFEFVPGSSEDQARKVEGEYLELAICNQQAVETAHLEFLPLLCSALVGCVRPDHPLAGRENVTAPELADEKLIFMSENATLTREIRRWFSTQHIKPNTFMYSNRSGVTVSMIQRYNAVAFYLEEAFAGNRRIQQEEMKAFTLSPCPMLTHGLVRKKGRKLSREARRFFNFCVSRQLMDT